MKRTWERFILFGLLALGLVLLGYGVLLELPDQGQRKPQQASNIAGNGAVLILRIDWKRSAHESRPGEEPRQVVNNRSPAITPQAKFRVIGRGPRLSRSTMDLVFVAGGLTVQQANFCMLATSVSDADTSTEPRPT